MAHIPMRGLFVALVYDRQGQMLRKVAAPNAITSAGVNSLFDVYFRNQTQLANWYMGLIRDDSFSALSEADTMASHAGWEEGDEYDEATRPAWSADASSSKLISNSVSTDFTINDSETFKGLFLTSDNTIGGTSGTLWSTALFTDDQVMQSGEVLKVFYELDGREG